MINTNKDYLANNLNELPYFRAVLRAVESRFYQDLSFGQNVLDLGCGDGLFAQSTFEFPISMGVDPSMTSLIEARRVNKYKNLILGSGGELPFPCSFFDTVISNSVLEHIPEVEPVIKEVGRVIKPGGMFYFCVPNPNFTKQLSMAVSLDKIKFHWLADTYRKMFNVISRHHHCDDPLIWKSRLESAGLVVLDNWDYFSPSALKVLEWGHLWGIPNLVQKKILGRWVIFSQSPGRKISERICRPIYDSEVRHLQGAYTFYKCQKLDSDL